MNKDLICLLLILALVSFGCSGSALQTETNYQTTKDVVQIVPTDESYAVYSAFLKTINTSYENGEKVTLFVINEDTRVDKFKTSIDQFSKHLDTDLLRDFKSAAENYDAINKEPQKLKSSFNLEKDYVLITQDEINASFKANKLGKGWEAFYKRFPHSAGLITFSKVGFDAEKKHAFLFFDLSCGGLCAEQSYLLLTKEQGNWEITKKITVGVS